MSSVPKLSASPVAPWAEIVPGMPLMTVDDLQAIPDEGWVYELVQGVLVRMPMSGLRVSSTAMRLAVRLSTYVEDRGLGVITGEQGGYRLDPGHPRDTELAPDVAFVRADRLLPTTSPDYDKAPQLAPDLAVEVASENQFAPGMSAKAKTNLSFRTRLVWVVWPRYQRVDVWHPSDNTPISLGVEDILSGEDVVPGFTYPIARPFP